MKYSGQSKVYRWIYGERTGRGLATLTLFMQGLPDFQNADVYFNIYGTIQDSKQWRAKEKHDSM